MASEVPPITRICSSAPVAAPLVKPMMSGLPNGLRVSAWNAAPEAPSAAPMATAHSARASRRSSTTKSVAVDPPPVNAASTSAAGSGKSPTKHETPTAATTATPITIVMTSGRRATRKAHRPTLSAANGTAAAIRVERGHSWATRRRRTSAMNTGAPMIAVTMPTLSSAGRTTTRPMMSAPTSRIGASTAV